MVQVRWGHLNREFSILTQAQSIFLDGHFIIEHTARNRSGCFFNFNGTAGIWRRSTIDDAGGWQHDTLTEDLDLSYRAQLKGWQFIFLPEVVSPAEVPVDMNAFKSQQHRWAKGSIQTARKLLPTILRVEPAVRGEARGVLPPHQQHRLPADGAAVGADAAVDGGALQARPVLRRCSSTCRSSSPPPPRSASSTWPPSASWGSAGWQRVKYLPFIMSLGIGLAINNAKAVIEALLNQQSALRPHAEDGQRGQEHPLDGEAQLPRHAEHDAAARAGLRALLHRRALVRHRRASIWTSVPFLVLFQVGFLYVGAVSLFQGRSIDRRALAPAVAPAPSAQRAA